MEVENVVQNVIAAWGTGHYAIASNADLHEANLLKLDASKAKVSLGWRTVWTCEKAITKSVEWYAGYFAGKNTRRLVQGADRYIQREFFVIETRRFAFLSDGICIAIRVS